MAKSNFQRRFEEKVKEAVENRADNIAKGGAADYSQYRESVGFILGLQESLRISEELESEDR